MTMTIVEANRMVQQLKEEIDQIRCTENASMVYSHSEGEEPFPLSYEFAETQKKLQELNEKILKIRHAVSAFNVQTEVEGVNLTVDSVLIKIAMLNEQKKKFSEMLKIQAVSRKTGYQKVEIVHRNFNDSQVRKANDEVSQELNHLRAALDLTNLTKTIEVEF